MGIKSIVTQIVECWTWGWMVSSSRLTGGALLCPWARHCSLLSIGSMQEGRKKSWHDWKFFTGMLASIQINKHIYGQSPSIEVFLIHPTLYQWGNIIALVLSILLFSMHTLQIVQSTLFILDISNQELWQTVKTQMRCCIRQHFIRVCSVW